MKKSTKAKAAAPARSRKAGKQAAPRLRSQAWFDNPANADMTALYIERTMNFGLGLEELQSGRPIIGIAQSGSDIAPCNRHHLVLAERMREGIRDAGGIAFEFPLHPIQETCKRPTASLDRNLQYLSLVEVLYGYPIDGVVLTTGCDKTTPAQIMAAATVDIPAIALNSGPMLNGWYDGQRTGSGTIVWRAREMMAAGEIGYEGFLKLVASSAPSTGHCNTMGTASTMALVAEALGVVVPGVAGTPAPDARLLAAAHETGRLAVELVAADRRPSSFLTAASFHNAIVALAAIGGSTNAVVHLLAIAGRLGIDLTIDDFDRIGADVPLLVNLQPAGHYLMDDLYRAGGFLAVLREVRDLLDPDALTVTGRPLVDHLDDARIWDADVITPRDSPLQPHAGISVLRGSLAPGGALIKPAAASPHLLKHRGRAVVFDSIEDFHARIDDPDLDIDEDSVMVLRGCGPKGYPGMPEVSNMPLPAKLLARGVRDMVRVCDGRMSGTAYGTVVLHVTPEAAASGPLALVRTGDWISLDVRARRLDLEVPADELAGRMPNQATLDGYANPRRGWERLYVDHVLQADRGADLDFLVGSSGSEVSRESH